MSKQTESHSKVFCFENECAFWDEEMNMCCIKSAAIAVAGKPFVGTKPIYFDIGHPPLQDPDYIPLHNANSTGNPYQIEGNSVCNTDDMIKKLNINIGGSI